jgi:hypothetical protein
MNSEEFCNGSEGSMPWWYQGWRCIHCGDVVDPLILQHRREPRAQPSLSRARRRAA